MTIRVVQDSEQVKCIYIMFHSNLFLGALYCAPELLKMKESNRRRGTDKNWLIQSRARRQSADIYAFGMVMYELLFRGLPYPENTLLNGVIIFLCRKYNA